jgi:hypothetical protein
VPRQRRRVGPGAGARGRRGIRRRVCGGQLTYRATATYVRDPEPGERPDGKQRSSSVPGCGSRSAALHGTPDGRTKASKKIFCCVTTRRRILRILRRLRRGFDALAVRALRLGVLRFDGGVQAASGLSLGCLPTPDLPPAFRILAVTLVPAPRLVLLSAAFAQADPRSGTARAGTARALWFMVGGTHGSVLSQGTAREERATVLPERLSKSGTRPPVASLPSPAQTRQVRNP